MATSFEIFQRAVAHHQAGQLHEAEVLYRKVLKTEPRQPDVLHLLGVLMQQNGHTQEAIELISGAIRLSGNQPAYHSNLGEVYRATGQQEDACLCYRQALKLKPDYPEAHNNLGASLMAMGKMPEAEASFREALRCLPEYSDAYNNLGLIRQHEGDYIVAEQYFRHALALNPHSAKVMGNLATVFNRQGLVDEAIALQQKALAISPNDSELNVTGGAILEQRGQYADALALYERAVQLRPGDAAKHYCVGSVLHKMGRLERAAPAYEQALSLKPDYVEALNNCSALYNELSRPDAALSLADRGLELAPFMGALHANRQLALRAQGRPSEAIEAGHRAYELRRYDAGEHSNYLYALNLHAEYDAATIFQEHLKWARVHAEPLTARAEPHANDRSTDRRLRVGYVSPYFRQHAVNYFVEPILRSHDREQFEIYCYADLINPDDTTARLKESVDHWREVRILSDEALAELIRKDQIDILLDLSGHIGGNRLLAFARKPAPVQVTYIGYQNTTGMSAMDYRLTDARADPPGVTDGYYTERLVRLEPTFYCYQPLAAAPPINPLPALANGYITFGSFNNYMKVSEPVLMTWLAILAGLPGSRLLVLASRGGYVEGHLRELTVTRGIEPERVEVFDKMPTDDYLRLQQRADIALDSFPFNGHTTTCDSIWMGLPVVMLEGDTYASRFGGSVLAQVGLERSITRTTEDYIQRAMELASDVLALARLRNDLRARMAASALLNYQSFTRTLETSYRQMWHDWCRIGSRGSGRRPKD